VVRIEDAIDRAVEDHSAADAGPAQRSASRVVDQNVRTVAPTAPAAARHVESPE
jgi:hypothetical protein